MVVLFFKGSKALEAYSLVLENFKIFELDNLSSLEIKSINDYAISKELITMYFRKDIISD
ncbi:hypothetical protein P3294_07055 [Campylobacter jejuni]|uniref:hypothetical protein n=1 Tax=Campylobacter TaxID=194 RepID=UPI000258956F|nr:MULTISPECIES: hypothetical protein [Campylobacter]EIB46269.1 hypothetical protein cje146_07680 [Campylobacter jejuni subsp. jejuni 2008-894]EAK1145216.1 hypothetical protein [Campylobacter jejuni]EAL9887183.1 hypothetical protein [Campylobacter jejuni]ECL6397475.1 hypothetical protein [Campylobacter jejuni]ECO2184697.1 hypothetical protein [Campylobacter jejuni]